MDLEDYVDTLQNACAATILYFTGPITPAKLEQWQRLTGTVEVTPEQLVNYVRRVLEQIPNVPEAPTRTAL